MKWKNWTQLIAAVIVLAGCIFIGHLVLPVLTGMTPVIGWVLGAVIVIVLASIGLGFPAAIVISLRHLHNHSTIKIIEARKLAVNERGYMTGYLSRQEQILVPQLTAFSKEVPSTYHIEEENSGRDSATMMRTALQLAKDIAAGRLLPAPDEQPLQVPGACTFSQVLTEFRPNAESLMIGYLPGREIVTSTASGLCHVALAGATGGGKSSLIRLIIAQLCAVGATVLLLNPHYTRFDVDAGEDWTPFEPYLYAHPMKCRDYRVIAGYLQQVAEEMLPGRLEKYAHSQPVGAPFYIVLDELPAIVKHVPGAPGWMADILREGRKVKLFLVTAAQDFLVKTIMGKDGSGAVRDCFRTAVYVGGDPTTARVLLDVKGAVDDGGLGRGVVMLRSSQVKQAALARVPYVDNESLYRLLGPSTYEGFSRSEVRSPVERNQGDYVEGPARVVVDADMPDMEPLTERPATAQTSTKIHLVQPVEQSDSETEESPKEYRLSEEEIGKFIAAYRASGNIEKALAAINRGSRYKKHASEIVRAYGLRKEA